MGVLFLVLGVGGLELKGELLKCKELFLEGRKEGEGTEVLGSARIAYLWTCEQRKLVLRP